MDTKQPNEAFVAKLQAAFDNEDLETFVNLWEEDAWREVADLKAEGEGMVLGDLKPHAETKANMLKAIKTMLKPILDRNTLLSSVHWHARGVMRYNGVDRDRMNEHFDRMKDAVYAVNDFDTGVEVDVD